MQSEVEPRVLHVDEQRGWRGGEQQMLYLARGLQQRGVRTACVLQEGSPTVERCGGAGIPVHPIRMRNEADVIAAYDIAGITRQEGFNVLHAHTAHAHSLILLAARLCMAGAAVVAHRRIEYPVGKGMLGLGALKYRFGTDVYVAISNRVKDTLIEVGIPEWRIYVVHSVTDPARFIDAEPNPNLRQELGIPQDAYVVGNIAMLVGHKDHRTFLEAARIVRDQVPEAWFVIVGEGPLRDSIADKARAMHMHDRLVMPGYRRDVPQFIKTFDVFALSSSEEGLCSTLLEVAAGGCPIVATDAGGVREAVVPEQTGIIVPTGSASALAQGVLRLRENPEEARQFARRGRRRVLAHFNPDMLTERTLEVYRRVLARDVSPENPAGYCDV